MLRRLLVLLFTGSLLLIASSVSAGLSPLERLGKELFFDKIASPDNMSCASCHAPRAGWTGPIGGINKHGAVYHGAVPQRFGNRKPPSAAYATPSPIFHYDASEGLFEGGNFWDGRATGEHLGNPAADQALGPFLNPVEQNNPSARAVLEQVAASKYRGLWTQVWGMPVSFVTPADVNRDYDRIGLAIAAYEASAEVNQYSSKFDYHQRGMIELTPQEAWGMELFDGKGQCSACHAAPLFTDFTFDNLGVPKNPQNPFYDMDAVLLDNGQPINPEGEAWIDLGLGGFLASQPAEYFTALGLDKAATVAANIGKHKVPTLRNVDLRPDMTFPKAYMHNGAFKSLKEVVHFYNTRDVGVWPAPEVAQTVNTDELGHLGLSDAEEDAIVAFMATLSDGYVLPVQEIALSRSAAPQAARPDFLILASEAGQYRLAYRVPVAGRARMVVYDVGGRHLQTLLDDWREPGAYALEWSANGFVSGLYFVRFDIGGTSQTRKVIVQR